METLSLFNARPLRPRGQSLVRMHIKYICICQLFPKFSSVQDVPAFRDFWYQKGITKFGDHEF